jgi:CBS domain-containing protein
MRLIDILRPEHIIAPLSAGTVGEAVGALVQRLVETGAVVQPDALSRLTSDEHIRDVVHIGDRILLPHMRTDAVSSLVVALGVAPEGLRRKMMRHSGASRRSPVHGEVVQSYPEDSGGRDADAGPEQVVVLVLAPTDASNRYLQMVAALARALREPTTVDRLVRAASADEVLEIAEIRDLTVQPRLAVRDIMTQRVYRVFPDTPVRELLDVMTSNEFKAVPVVNDKREVLGVVTDRDLLKHLMPSSGRVGADSPASGSGDRAGLDTPVKEIMSRSVMCISEDQGVSEVSAIMINKDVERLPVVAEGKLTGFLTRGDILRKLYGQ